MYAGFFGLQQLPFSIAPDPHYLFMSERHREALAHLLYGVQGGGGFVLLTGEIGAGKTTVCRAFLEQIPDNCRVAYIFNPKLTVSDLLKTVCHEFQIEVQHDGEGPATIKDYLDPLNEHLLACHAAGQHNLLIIDEAQNLSAHVLEQLRLLTNLETNERKLLQIVLIGQPELRIQLAQPELEQLAQRVIARFHLGALSEAETRQYVQHRMAVAGHSGPLPFDGEALARIHALTRGVPRRINLLCDRALLGAYVNETRQIGRAIVDKAADEVFDLPAQAQAVTPRQGGWIARHPWATLALGALGGAALVGAATMALWQRPASVATPVASRAAPAPEPIRPAAPVAPAPAVSSVANAPAVAAAPANDEQPTPISGPPAAGDLLASENAAWRELGPLWGLALNDSDPCAQAQQNGLQCFRQPRMTLHGLRLLNRPGILTLQLPAGPARALLTALTPERATLQSGERRWHLPLTALADIWRGEFATLWRTPPGTTERIHSAGNPEVRRWLDAQLSALQVKGQIPPEASSPAARLAAFQRSQGIAAQGKATPMTFMQVNLASGVDEPRLNTP